MRAFLYAVVAGTIVAALPSVSRAQGIMSWSGENFSADWPQVRACARKSVPWVDEDDPDVKKNGMLSQKWRAMDREWQTVTMCRLALAARHQGWIAATDKPDPEPPEPAMRPDDLRRKP